MKTQPWRPGLFSLLLLLIISPASAVTIGEVKKSKLSGPADAVKKTGRWSFRPALNGGYNKLLTGYDGYDDLGKVGLDLYVRRLSFGESVGWNDNVILRLSLDYFPLQVPEGLNGIEEDVYAAHMSVLYEIHTLGRRIQLRWPWFFGVGYGLYRDEVTVENSTVGKITSTKTFKGFTYSAGLTIPPMKLIPFKLIPEVRYHRYKSLEASVSHIVYQLGVVLWPREN